MTTQTGAVAPRPFDRTGPQHRVVVGELHQLGIALGCRFDGDLVEDTTSGDAAEQTLGATSSEVGTWEVAVMHRDHASPDGACARVTWLSGDQGLADRAADVYRTLILPTLQDWDGFCSANLMISRDAGRIVGTVTFERRDQLEATREAAKDLRQRASERMNAIVDEVAEMEVAMAHLHVPELV